MKKWLLLLLFPIAIQTQAQEAKFNAHCDTNSILIGEQVTLHLYAQVTQGSNFVWPILSDTLQHIEVVKNGSIDTVLKDNIWELHQAIKLTSFDSGYAAIPPLTLGIDDKLISSTAIGIEVDLPKLQEEQDLYDIKEPIDAPINWLLILLVVCGILVTALIIWAIVRTIKKRKDLPAAVNTQTISPYDYALQQLQKIEREQLWQQNKLKEYYTRITDVARLFLNQQANLPAMESTAQEVNEMMEPLALNELLLARMKQLMELSMMVKFAKKEASGNSHKEAMETIKAFLLALKPTEKKDLHE